MHDLQSAVDTDTERKIGYVGGGSTGWAHTLMENLALAADPAGEVALYDIDTAAAERNAEFGNCVQRREDAVSDSRYRAYDTPEAALAGTDLVEHYRGYLDAYDLESAAVLE